jgi:hypothetical protein
MPFVPFDPGVPPLTSYAPLGVITLLTQDALAFLGALFGPPWGIFLSGVPIIQADSVVSFEYRQEWTVSDYPVEQGAFETYDKVELPFEGKFRFSAGGSEVDRFALLQSIADIADSVTLLDIVTPEQVYPSITIYHYDYRRTATNGVGLLQVDVWCREVRVTTTTAFSNTQQPSGANAQGTGNVQTQTPTNTQSSEEFQ